jgi:hypothetical protein
VYRFSVWVEATDQDDAEDSLSMGKNIAAVECEGEES